MTTVLHLLPSLHLHGGTPRKISEYVRRSALRHLLYVTGEWGGAVHTREAAAALRAEGFEITLGPAGHRVLSHIGELHPLIRRHRVGVIQTYFNYDDLLAALLTLRHPSLHWVSGFVGAGSPASPWRRLLLSVAYRRARAVTFISEYVRRAKVEAFPVVGTLPSHTIYNGVAPRASGSGTTGGEIHVVSTSGLNPHKNLTVLIDASARLRRSMPDLRVVVLGEGPSRPEIEARIDANGLADHVSLPGYREDVGGFLARSRIYAHPAHDEGFGIAVVEAMLHGMPIVAANAGALPELIEDEVTGLLVDTYDPGAWAVALRRLLDDPGYARALGDRARQSAERRFDVHEWARRLDHLYSSVAADV